MQCRPIYCRNLGGSEWIVYALPPKFLQKPSPYFFHGAFAPPFIWRRRPCWYRWPDWQQNDMPPSNCRQQEANIVLTPIRQYLIVIHIFQIILWIFTTDTVKICHQQPPIFNYKNLSKIANENTVYYTLLKMAFWIFRIQYLHFIGEMYKNSHLERISSGFLCTKVIKIN